MLRDEIDRQFNLVQPTYVITGGMFSMVLDSQKRIRDWDIYTNPARWTRQTLPRADARPATPIVDAAFDGNGHAQDIGEPEIHYDAQRGTICLCWGKWRAGMRWLQRSRSA
ncbi:hypothetical protein LJ656_18825 [Paraburkholderia sp. MMS20-SJTR3]|uniref:Uncharacterized protein n=1 Tax=Paraburkholderia sejongensis TaxID=2886946 RepID=A0ABS8JY41_9BURK|nr:hypothetical protein [Paraburkholderia sp. MMS20-SJTR3]MCC8394650.1 hypothetical protein [Paraburkholderia sp. MMS20-SJTR3]